MLVGTTPDGEGDRIGPRRSRSDVRLLREGCPRKLSRSAQPGPRNPARETITRTPAATSPQARLTSPAPCPCPLKSPESNEEIEGNPRAIPKCEHRQDWVAEGAVSREPVSHVAKRIKDEYLMGPYYVPLHTP